ncbi:MAG: site-2 protease family protein, partial [Clostridia bacterium]|nr:site-2 protease family protein [Deltaproteobacteria bacterium]
VVAVIDNESPAALAGILTGDRVVRVQGVPVAAWYEVHQAVHNVDGEVRLSIQRGEDVREISLVPGAAPAGIDGTLMSAADARSGYTGLVSKESTLVRVDPETPASVAGLAVGDRVIALTTHDAKGIALTKPVHTYSLDLLMAADARDAITMTVQRGREVSEHEVHFTNREEKDELKNVRKSQVFGAFNDLTSVGVYTASRWIGPAEAFTRAVRHVGDDMTLIVKGIAKIAQGDIPLDNMGGPIMLFVIAEKSAKSGLMDFLTMVAVISVNLGLVNLVPVPVLDGGHLMFLGIEAVRRRPPSVRVREVANVVGLVMLLMLMVLVFKNDIFRFVLG